MSEWLRNVWDAVLREVEGYFKIFFQGLEALIPIEAPVDDMLAYIEAVMPYIEVANRLVALDWLLYYFGLLLALRGFLYVWRLAVRIWELIPFN